jgi:hypothetical protein
MSSKAHINVERSGLGVHASNEHDVSDSLLDGEIRSIIVGVIVNELSDESNRLLGEIFIDLGHVKIIHKVDEGLASGRTVKSTGSLVNVRLNNNLETHGVGVRVEINLGGEDTVGVNRLEVIQHNRSLTSTSGTNVKDTFLGLSTYLEDQFLSGSFGSSHDNRGEIAFSVGVESLDLFIPVNPLHIDGVEVVIIDRSSFGELDLAARSSEVAVEVTLGLINASSERPNRSKGEEAVVDELNLVKRLVVLLSFLSELTEVLSAGLGGSHLLHLVVNNTDKRLNPGDFDHGLTDIVLCFHGVKEAFTDVLGLAELELSNCNFVLSLGSLLLELGQPGVVVRLPSDISIVNEEHTTTGDSGRSSVSKVSYLNNETHLRSEGNTLVGHKGENLVIIHDSVEGLNPLGIDISVHNNPLVLLFVSELTHVLHHVSEHGGEHTITPFLGL